MSEVKRSRAALLPHPADPFMFRYWLKFFNEIWQSEVDRLYIYINSPIEKPVIDWMLELCRSNSKINVQYNNVQTEHGYAIDRMLDIVTEENIMLIEDDGYIFKPGYVDKYFTKLEVGGFDVIGSPRGSCSLEIWDEAKKIWNLDYSGIGDVGPNFWPCYFFTRKDILLRTDRNFAARAWKRGEKITPLLDYVVKDEVCTSDTFVNTSLQIRAMIPKNRILTIPQYHGSPDDLEHFETKYNLFNGFAFWTHVGSLSSGTHGALIDDSGRRLARRFIDPPVTPIIKNQANTEQERREWERRVQWWKTFAEYSASLGIPDNVKDFYNEYLKAIERIIKQFSLSRRNIEKRQAIYKTIGL